MASSAAASSLTAGTRRSPGTCSEARIADRVTKPGRMPSSVGRAPAVPVFRHARARGHLMAPCGASIGAVAMAVPSRLVSNREIAEQLGVEEQWIAKRTGTSERPWAEQGERMTEFAAQAGKDALERAGVDPGQLDLVVVATSTADEITPNAAPLVAGLIGADRAGAFD